MSKTYTVTDQYVYEPRRDGSLSNIGNDLQGFINTSLEKQMYHNPRLVTVLMIPVYAIFGTMTAANINCLIPDHYDVAVILECNHLD